MFSLTLRYDFLNDIVFPLGYLTIRMERIMHTTYKICVIAKASSQQEAISSEVLESQNLYADF